MKFILENPEPPSEPLFSDVEIDQFFVARCGYLCQKVTGNSYNIVADAKGFPLARPTHKVDCVSKLTISRILPKVAKIEF